MRIGIMIDAYKPHVSGITRSVAVNKKALEGLGHEVVVFAFGDLDHADDEPNIVRSPGLPLTSTDYYVGFRYTNSARRRLQSMDIVHIQHPFLSGWLAQRYCRPYNIPLVFTNHTRYDLYAQAYLRMLPEQIGATFLQAYMPAFCSDMDLVIAPTQGLREVLAGLGVKSPVEVVPNGVDLGPFRAPADPIPRSSLGFRPDDVLLIYVGRLGPEKNLTFLVRGFAAVHQAHPRAGLLIVGDGPERDNLENLVERSGLREQVRFVGMVDYSMVRRYLAAADLFATASVTEVQPLSVIEAMASGLPVVGVRSRGVGDLVADGVTGLLSGDDLASYAAVATRLVSEKGTRRRMGLHARQAAEQYAIELTSASLESHYRHLVAEGPKRRRRAWRVLWQRAVDRWT
jgi:glycosyltransferase involved in cell wall biosynthesis